jgi:3-methyladenine DNA glycosylase AlkD
VAATAEEFTAQLQELRTDEQREKYKKYFKSGPGDYGEGDVFIGVPMGKVFALAKESLEMPLDEIERLMESEIHEARAGAMSVMDKQARRKKSPQSQRKALYELYLRRIDRVNNWDLVDLAAIHAVGGYIYEYEQPRAVLYELAASENLWERRTAIVATAYFLTKKETDDTFAIAELLIDDDEDLIHKAAGGWVRHAGKTDPDGLIAFLDKNATRMPRTMLTYAMEHLTDEQRAHYRQL